MNLSEKKYTFTTNKEVSVVNFYVNWCFYSKIQKLILNKFQKQIREKVKVYFIDSDKNKRITEKFKVHTFPSILIFRNGDVVEHLTGLQDNDTLKLAVDKILKENGLSKN